MAIMKNLNRILRLLCVAALVMAAGLGIASGTENTTQITGEVITIESETSADTTVTEPSSTVTPENEPANLSNATLTISYETTSTEGDTETVTLFEGPYQEDFAHEIKTVEPTEVKIVLQVTEDSNPMTLNAVIGTSDIHLAFIDEPGPWDRFWLVGATDQVMNSENKFSVSGDLSFLDIDLTKPTSVEVYALLYDEKGDRQAKQWGPVLVKDGTFLIEGDVEKAISATLFTHGGHNTQVQIILEPQSELVIGKLGGQIEELSTISGMGYHAKLVESWQQDDEYIALMEAYSTEYEEYLKRRKSGEPEPETLEDDSNKADSNADAEDISDSEDAVDTVIPAEGCEDAVVQSTQSSSSWPHYISLRQQARDFRSKRLQKIAEEDEDPMARYLAINLGSYEWNDYGSKLEALQPLAKMLDEDFVATFITPKIEDYKQLLIKVQNDAALIPGQKIPAFALANYDGKEVGIYELLGKNDLVLIDFWASWCGPCIADFPELKELYHAYTDENFEIVGVSIDSTMEDWKGGVDDHELPWVNLGEVKGWDGPVVTLYGVNGIPRGFLVDSEGCIYKKNIRPRALKEFLVDRYGMDESLEEPREEPDGTTEESS